MELLRERDFIRLWYTPKGYVKAEWFGYYSPSRIKEGCQLILESFKEKNCKRGMNDARLAKGTFLQSVHWLRENFFPQMIEISIERIAFLLSPDPASRQSLERVLELNDQYDAQVFDDFQVAEKWLLDELEADSQAQLHWNDRLAIREKEKFTLLDYKDIMYIYSFEKGAALQCVEETHYTKLTLKELKNQIPENFIQVHRSYIVNADFVASIKYHNSGSYNLYLKEMPRIKVPVSKKHVASLKRLLNI